MSLKKHPFDKLDTLRSLAGTPYMDMLRESLTRVSRQLVEVDDVNAMLRIQGEARAISKMIDEIIGAEEEANKRLYGPREKVNMARAF